MNFFNEAAFYLGLAGGSIATLVLIVIQLNKDWADEKTKRYALRAAIVSAFLIIVSIFTGVNAHLEANRQEDSTTAYHRLYDSLLYSNLDSSHKSIDSTVKVIHTTDSILTKSIAIITEQHMLLQFEDSTRNQLNKQIIASKNALAKITGNISDFQTGKNSYCYVIFQPSIRFDKTNRNHQINGGYFALNGFGNSDIDYLEIHVIDNGTTKEHETLPPHSPEFFRLTYMNENIDKVANPSRLNNPSFWELFKATPLQLDSTRDYMYTMQISSARQKGEEHIKLEFVNGWWESAYELRVQGISTMITNYSYRYPDKTPATFKYFH